MNVHGRLAAHAAVLLALACACGGPRRRPEDYGASPERIEALPETARDDFQRVRRALDSGDTGVARAILDALVAARPEDIGGAVMLQELRLELASPQERDSIVQAARATAENAPTVVNLLLRLLCLCLCLLLPLTLLFPRPWLTWRMLSALGEGRQNGCSGPLVTLSGVEQMLTGLAPVP